MAYALAFGGYLSGMMDLFTIDQPYFQIRQIFNDRKYRLLRIIQGKRRISDNAAFIVSVRPSHSAFIECAGFDLKVADHEFGNRQDTGAHTPLRA